MSRLKDWYNERNPPPSKDSMLKFKQVVVATEFNIPNELRSHWKFKDQHFMIQPGMFNKVPVSIAEDYRGLPGYYILTEDQADEFVAKAREVVEEENEELLEERRKTQELNDKIRNEKLIGQLSQLPKLTNKTRISPFKAFCQSKLYQKLKKEQQR